MIRIDVNGQEVHGKMILNFNTSAPKNWGKHVKVEHRNLTVDLEGMTVVDLEDLLAGAWVVKFQAKERLWSQDTARKYSKMAVKWDIINAKTVKVKVREMTLTEIVEKAKNDPTYKAALLERLA
jgi:hypothetical protein